MIYIKTLSCKNSLIRSGMANLFKKNLTIMKKTKIFIIFIIGIILWVVSQQISHRYQALKSPLLQEHSLDMDALIDSITDVVHAEKYLSNDEKYERFDEVSNLLEEVYFDEDKLDSWHMVEEALKAYVDAIDDPYTVYMDAVTQSGFEESLKWSADFEWIGAVVKKKEYYVLIEEVLKDSPAFKAGLKPLDRIIAVDSGSVKDLDINEAVDKIKWPKWTNVTLMIERNSRTDDTQREIFEQKVTRDKMLIPSIRTKLIETENNKKIAYFDIAMIGEETESIFKKEIQIMKDEWFDGVIVDLRGNGWWFLTVWVQIISHFVPKGELVVSAKYKSRAPENYYSKWYGDLENYPVVVLVDDMTASAGEIIAMALQEQIWAKIVGIRTFGKWSIQTIQVYDDGDSLKYTIWKRYSPSGKNIDKLGFEPDIEVELDVDKYIDEDIDTQLEEAKSVLKGEM